MHDRFSGNFFLAFCRAFVSCFVFQEAASVRSSINWLRWILGEAVYGVLVCVGGGGVLREIVSNKPKWKSSRCRDPLYHHTARLASPSHVIGARRAKGQSAGTA